MKGAPTNRLLAGRSLHGRVSLQISPKEIHFKAGETFEGKVIQQKANGSILVTTGGKTFEARTSIPLAEGKSYSFLVRSVVPRIELKVLREEDCNGMSAGKLSSGGRKERLEFVALLRDFAASVLVKNMKSLFPLLLYQGPAHGDAMWLSANLSSSGIFWENKVLRHLLLDSSDEPVATLPAKDLKGLLLSMKMEAEASGSPARDTQVTMDQIDRLLSLLENQQALNLGAVREGWNWYWFLAGAQESEFLYGELLGKKEESGDLHHLRINLCFTRLGEIAVDCILQGRSVALSMQVPGERIFRFLEGNIPLLEKRIAKQGVVVTRCTCERVPDESMHHPLSRKGSPSGLMDVVI